MITVTLLVVLTLPGMEEGKPAIYTEDMPLSECTSAVREMTWRAEHELKNGGRLQVGCVVKVPKSENP